jgi:hypothetical protein
MCLRIRRARKHRRVVADIAAASGGVDSRLVGEGVWHSEMTHSVLSGY